MTGCGCFPVLLLSAFFGLIAGLYFFFPSQTNIFLLGIDQTPQKSWIGRSDTNMIASFQSSRPAIHLLSLPRDLWVSIPGFGENRINTAHFFAEAVNEGSGPELAMQTIRQNFGIEVGYFARIRFEGVRDIVDALGGVEIELSTPMAGYEPGRHTLNGRKALAFARNRSGTDDFFRMDQGQILVKAILKKALSPLNWYRLPGTLVAFTSSVDSNIPIWIWPRLSIILLRVRPEGIKSATISREMVTPMTTEQGAAVLLPNWLLIKAYIEDFYKQ